MDLNQLFLKHAAAAYDKQMALGDLIGNADWQFDMTTATLAFGSKYHFKIQVLGTESTHSHTWLWAWANEASGIPSTMQHASEELRAFGRQNHIPELTQTTARLSHEVNGHIFSMIASGLCAGNAYYRGPYDGGAVFMLIQDEAYPRVPVNPASRVSTLFPQLIANIPISNHKAAFLAYLQFYGARVKEEGNIITAKFSDNNLLRAKFLPDNRLENIQTKLVQ